MKIISKIKEYYDGIVNSLGIDENILYLRERADHIIVNIKKWKFHKSSDYMWRENHYELMILGFAGELYPVLRVIHIEEDKNTPKDATYSVYIYDIDEIRKEFDRLVTGWWRRDSKLEDFLSLLKNKEILNYFYEYKCGSFLLRHHENKGMSDVYSKLKLTTAPDLKEIEFHKQLDAFHAFINMQNFISERLNTEIDTFEVPDKLKIVSKGFDLKKSFRKRK